MDRRIVLRRWSSRIRAEDEDAYTTYIIGSGLKDYRKTAGNLGCQMLLRPLGDGSTEVTTLSWWTSMDAIRGFAGTDVSVARYYPEDDRFLLEKPAEVQHHYVVGGETHVMVARPQ